MRRSSTVLVSLLAASVFAGFAASATPAPAVVQDAHAAGARLAGPLRVVLSGEITCTAKARFTVYGWVLDRADGALAKGKTPPRVRPNTPAAARLKAATTCTGSAQPWSLVALATGRKALPFGRQPADTCITVYLKKSGHYADLKQSCAPLTIS